MGKRTNVDEQEQPAATSNRNRFRHSSFQSSVTKNRRKNRQHFVGGGFTSGGAGHAISGAPARKGCMTQLKGETANSNAYLGIERQGGGESGTMDADGVSLSQVKELKEMMNQRINATRNTNDLKSKTSRTKERLQAGP